MHPIRSPECDLIFNPDMFECLDFQFKHKICVHTEEFFWFEQVWECRGRGYFLLALRDFFLTV